MSLTYRTRKNLRTGLVAVLITVIVAVVAFSAWVIWADRYIIYTRDGAILNFDLPVELPDGSPALPPEPYSPVNIVIKSDEDSQDATVERTSISGYYISANDLTDNIPALMDKLQTLPAGTAVLMDMKTIKGSFYYDTVVGSTKVKDVDQEAMNQLLALIAQLDLHAIARIPAFRDWEYGLNNVPQGLPKKNGNGSLWMDDKNCYWLNPTKEEVLGYLIRIATELKSLGFDEVVFSEFRFPDTEKIKFEGDKVQALTDAAAILVEACASERFYVSFYSSDFAFTLPNGNTRIYYKDIEATDLPAIRDESGVQDPRTQLLFLTEANDTRYNDYCVLRPLENAIP